MADYSDYLAYLHHVDDTTLQEFKKREDELRHQIDVVRDQCQKNIKTIQERAVAENAQLVESYKAKLIRTNAEKDAAVAKLSNALVQIENEKKTAVEQAVARIEAEHINVIKTMRSQYESSVNNFNVEIEQLKETHKEEIQIIIEEKNALITKLTNDLAKIEAEKFSIRRIAAKIKASILALFMGHNSNRSDTETKTDKKKETDNSDKSRFCRKCGNTLSPGAIFCNKCGTKIN